MGARIVLSDPPTALLSNEFEETHPFGLGHVALSVARISITPNPSAATRLAATICRAGFPFPPPL